MNVSVKIHGMKLCDLMSQMQSNKILNLLTDVNGTTEHITEQRLVKLQRVCIPYDNKNETIIMILLW